MKIIWTVSGNYDDWNKTATNTHCNKKLSNNIIVKITYSHKITSVNDLNQAVIH